MPRGLARFTPSVAVRVTAGMLASLSAIDLARGGAVDAVLLVVVMVGVVVADAARVGWARGSLLAAGSAAITLYVVTWAFGATIYDGVALTVGLLVAAGVAGIALLGIAGHGLRAHRHPRAG